MLPSKPEIQRLRPEIETLGISDRAWIPGHDDSLEVLKLRLTEILEIVESSDGDRGGRSKDRKRGRPPDSLVEVIRGRVRRIADEAKGEGVKLSRKDLCERLDAHAVGLPPGAEWAKWGSWRRAYAEKQESVGSWLSQTLRDNDLP